jgi:RNA polymerase sigma-70 factor (ECF subfamily)
MMEVSDETLVQQAVRLQDLQAFETLVRRHEKRILHLQRRFIRNHATAEDLCQETFLRAWSRLDTFSGRGSFGAWLTKLAYNIFLQHRRKHAAGASRETSFEEEAEAGRAGIDDPAPNADEVPDLQRLLAVLPEADQIVLLLSYGHGLSIAEIAEVLDAPDGTIKSQIHRAKDKIRRHFSIGAAA